MYKMHMVQEPLDQVWTCPNCQMENVDNFADTTFPLCSRCDECYQWEAVVRQEAMDKLNAIYAKEVLA